MDAGSNSHSHYTQLNTRSKSQWDTHYTANDVLVDTSRSAKTSTQFWYFLITIHCMFSHNRYVLLRNHQLSKKKTMIGIAVLETIWITHGLASILTKQDTVVCKVSLSHTFLLFFFGGCLKRCLLDWGCAGFHFCRHVWRPALCKTNVKTGSVEALLLSSLQCVHHSLTQQWTMINSARTG